MAKKKFGKFVALATISGVIAAGISYFLKYKSFNDELDEDFHDFEGGDDEFDGQLPHASETPNRTYVTLSEKKDEAVDKMKDCMGHAAEPVKDMAEAAADAAGDIAGKADKMFDSASDKADEMSGMVKNAVNETAEAVKHAVNATATIEDDVL